MQSQTAIFVPDQETKDRVLPRTSHFAWRNTAGDKLLLLGVCILPLLASSALLVTTLENRTSTGRFLSFVTNNRATTQIIVYLISNFLASLNVYSVTKLINFATRIHLLQWPLSIDRISLVQATLTRSFATSLPAPMVVTSLITIALFAIPNVLWTGALTPVLTNTTIIEINGLKIPQYTTGSNQTWSNNNRIGDQTCTTVTNQNGVFSDCPISVIERSLLSRAAQATSNLTQTFSKNDNSHYSYVDRSYGVGSPAGLVDENLYNNNGGPNLLSYNYTEPGYYSSVPCFQNVSTDFHLEKIQDGKPGNGIPYIYYALGLFPNSPAGDSADFFSVVGLNGDSDIAVVAAKRKQGTNIILLTAGSRYIELNETQCEVDLTLTNFTVHVNVADKLIYVRPTSSMNVAGTTPPSFDPTAGLATSLMDQINALGMSSTTLYMSVIGEALISNIRSAANRTTNSSSPSSSLLPPSSAANSAALADSFSAMLDELLVFIGSSQFFIPASGAGDFSTVDAQLTVSVIRVGDSSYVFATFGVCVVLLAGFFVEACRTNVWNQLPRWDFSNTKDLMQASAVAGADVVNEMCEGARARDVQWAGGGSGAWFEGWWKGRQQSWTEGDEHKGRSPIQLRVGKKVFKSYQIQRECCEKCCMGGKEGQGAKLTAVSMWTRRAKDVARLK